MVNCDIIEFGAVLDDLSNQLPLEQLPVFHTYFQKNLFLGEPFALSMHKEIFLRIAERKEGYSYTSTEKLGNQFKQFLLKNGYNLEKDRITINVAGKNFNSFDLQFLKNKTDFCKHVQPSAKVLDPAILYYQKGDDRLPGLSKCLERAGFSSTVKHCAVDDAFDVVKLIRARLS
jgi:hypothetical protein